MSKLTKAAPAALVPGSPSAVRAEVAILYRKDGESYWVRGYELFDPGFCHSTNGGRMPLKVKTARTRPGCAWVMMRGQEGKPIQYEASRLAPVQPGKHYFTFQEVFGSSSGTGVVVINAEIESADDLSMGLSVDVTDDDIDF